MFSPVTFTGHKVNADDFVSLIKNLPSSYDEQVKLALMVPATMKNNCPFASVRPAPMRVIIMFCWAVITNE